MRKRVLQILIVIILVVTGIIVWKIYKTESTKQTGTEWFEKQSEYVDQFETWSDSLDDVTTLFVTGSIDENDFTNHLSIAEKELKLMQASYDQELKNHPVKTGTHNYYSKLGCESVYNCFSILQEIIDMEREEMGRPAELCYKYLSYHQKVIAEMSSYAYCRNALETVEQEGN